MLTRYHQGPSYSAVGFLLIGVGLGRHFGPVVRQQAGPQASGVVGGIERFKKYMRNAYCSDCSRQKMSSIKFDQKYSQFKNLSISENRCIDNVFTFWKFASTNVIGGVVDRNENPTRAIPKHFDGGVVKQIRRCRLLPRRAHCRITQTGWKAPGLR